MKFKLAYKPIEPERFSQSMKRYVTVGSGAILGGWAVHIAAKNLEAVVEHVTPERLQFLAEQTDLAVYSSAGLLMFAGARLSHPDAGHADAYRITDYELIKPAHGILERSAIWLYKYIAD